MPYLISNIIHRNPDPLVRQRAPGGVWIFESMLRVVPERPLEVSDELLNKHAEEIRKYINKGWITVSGLDGSAVDPKTFEIKKVESGSPPLPNFPLDSLANDKNSGRVLPPEGQTEVAPENFQMPVEPPPAAVTHPIVEERHSKKGRRQ